MRLTKSSISLGAVSATIGVVAALTASPVLGVVAALFAALAFFSSEKASARKEADNATFRTESQIAIAAAETRAAEAVAEGAKAHERTKALEREAQKLKAAMLPRRIIMGARDDDREIRQARFKEVAKYAGTQALIQAVVDVEAQTLAGDIREALRISGWNPVITTEAQSRIPQGLITGGVQVLTFEKSPFIHGSMEILPASLEVSKAGHAARAVVELLSLDLGPPFGPRLFGVHWSPVWRDGPSSLPYGFEFPDGAVAILVGSRPVEYLVSLRDPSAKN